ncbi:MAG: hypothetical protein H7039_06620 [Bryobacteraceae bacterium]|nr:hypothetical protein [Bryobacteraceae bacterium]
MRLQLFLATLLIAHKWSDSVGWYDSQTGKALATVPVGVRPHEMAWSADRKLIYVTNYGLNTWTQTEPGGNTISIIDPAGRKEIGRIELGENRRPHGIELGRKSGRLYVTVDWPGALLVVDPVRKAVVSRHEVGKSNPHMVAVTRDESTAFVANSASGTVSLVRLTGDTKPVAIEVGGVPMGVELAPDESICWVATRSGNQVVGINVGSGKVVHRIDVKGEPARLRAVHGGSLLLVSLIGSGEIAVLDLKTRQEVRRLTVGKSAEGMFVDTTEKFLYVSAQGDNKVVKFDMTTWKPVLEVKTADRPDPILEF